MYQNKRIISGGAQLFFGQIASQFLAFLRNFVVARLLVPEDFGIASTFAVTITALEQLSDFSLEKVIVRDRNGNREDFQSTIHFMNFLRNLVLAAIIFLSAGLIADVFRVPDAKPAYQLLALVPIIRAFMHLDVFRVQRDLIFSVDIKANIISQLCGLIVAGALAYFTRHYSAVLWGVIVHSLVYVAVTHIMADRTYTFSAHRPHIKAAFSFGWPLVINGIVLMLSTQADRILVGNQLGMLVLAQYTVAVLLVSVPGQTITKIVSTLALPWLADMQDDREKFQTRYDTLGQALSVVTILGFVPLIVVGSDFIILIFGHEYLGSWSLIGWLAVAMAIRFMRARMVNTFLAIGTTKDLMYSETIRILGILFAFVAIKMGGSVVSVAMSVCCGEILAFVFCILRLNALPQGPVPTVLSSYSIAALALAASLSLLIVAPELALVWRILVSLAIMVACLGMQLWFARELRIAAREIPTIIQTVMRFRTGGY